MNSAPADSKAVRRGLLFHAQSGMGMIEVLVAILIFSIGILGIVGLQATAIKQVSDAKYRIDAANLAQQLIGQMWAEDHLTATLVAKYAATTSDSSSAGYLAWKAVVLSRLPGASSNPPSVTIEADSGDSSRSTVTLVVYWLAPGATTISNYTTVSRIR